MIPLELHPQASQISGGCDPSIPQLCNLIQDQILHKLLFLQPNTEQLSICQFLQQRWEATNNNRQEKDKTCARQIRKSFDTIPICFNTANLVNSAQVQDTKSDGKNVSNNLQNFSKKRRKDMVTAFPTRRKFLSVIRKTFAQPKHFCE
jgi:uncharacterized protein (DUF1800 family)